MEVTNRYPLLIIDNTTKKIKNFKVVKMKRIEDVNTFIQDLTNNVVKSTNKHTILERLKRNRLEINKPVNSKEVQKKVNILDEKIIKLGTAEIDYFICLEKDKDYYYNKCIEAIELMGDLTLKFDDFKRYDYKKDLLWTYVGILVKDDEMINWHHRDKKNSE